MAILEWEDRYSVGVAQIDSQHMRLVDMINELHEAMRNRRTDSALAKIVDDMAGYAATHFAAEEEMMRRFAYPNSAQHREQHAGFTEKAVDLQTRLANGSLVLSMEVVEFLRDWLTSHILGADLELGLYLNSKGEH